eukprot:CAMPEP_0184532888 /NCGR_PEP_ID=MMETSP0198_2-20121128/14425_1 /TAXON_ID=1112570 /ORGANISM="Thraustochytrium sp., Strain LLF1b" /LENGTH=137 /DNA_ID=CAMNT_0026925551 /DNA_START=276 /DNA_END=685 /DNA_ORIENTATION=+
MSIGVGSFSDPRGREGLAHLLEHMVFMGSESFPKENHFDEVCQNAGGSNNAFTSAEETCYHFEVQQESLDTALAVFASMLHEPLLKKESAGREVEAVENEFVLERYDPSWLVDLMRGYSAREEYAKFCVGNIKSLNV